MPVSHVDVSRKEIWMSLSLPILSLARKSAVKANSSPYKLTFSHSTISQEFTGVFAFSISSSSLMLDMSALRKGVKSGYIMHQISVSGKCLDADTIKPTAPDLHVRVDISLTSVYTSYHVESIRLDGISRGQ